VVATDLVRYHRTKSALELQISDLKMKLEGAHSLLPLCHHFFFFFFLVSIFCLFPSV
jgi:hypothetical protein